MRIDLGQGQWAELRERLSYGQAREVRFAYLEAADSNEAKIELDIRLVRAYVLDWYVLGEGGNPVSTSDPSTADDETIQTVAEAAAKLWNSAHSPKAKRSSGPSRNGSGATTLPELVPSS